MKLYYYLINNAGSLGDLNDSSNFNLISVQRNMDLNVTSMLFLTSRVLHQLESHATGLIIVNISSLAAIQPFECWGIYCVNKAARDMFIRVIAEEVTSFFPSLFLDLDFSRSDLIHLGLFRIRTNRKLRH